MCVLGGYISPLYRADGCDEFKCVASLSSVQCSDLTFLLVGRKRLGLLFGAAGRPAVN